MCALGGLVKDNEKWKKYVEICSRNHRKVSADLDAYISDVIRNHDEGNDQFKITGWFDNYDMRAVPMIMSQNDKFEDYFKNCDRPSFDSLKIKLGDLNQLVQKTIRPDTDNYYDHLDIPMEFFDKDTMEKSEKEYIKRYHDWNVKFYAENNKKTFLKKAGVQAWQ